jgi:GrpB-like predicted nucleotidyltransferase (UPF0157 family)
LWDAESDFDKNDAMTDGGPVVVGYSGTWPVLAAWVLEALKGPFSGLATRFEHIGSTAIPGMAAKDVLDLQISVFELDGIVDSVAIPLRSLGFKQSPYESDHIPAGTTDSPANWAKRLWLRRTPDEVAVNLHVRRAGSPNERLALLFRDWFRAHPEAVQAYASFKRSLAGLCPNIGVYSDIKDPVVDVVMSGAEEWAASTGWRP